MGGGDEVALGEDGGVVTGVGAGVGLGFFVAGGGAGVGAGVAGPGFLVAGGETLDEGGGVVVGAGAGVAGLGLVAAGAGGITLPSTFTRGGGGRSSEAANVGTTVVQTKTRPTTNEGVRIDETMCEGSTLSMGGKRRQGFAQGAPRRPRLHLL